MILSKKVRHRRGIDMVLAQKLREEREKLEEQRRLRDTCARIQV